MADRREALAKAFDRLESGETDDENIDGADGEESNESTNAQLGADANADGTDKELSEPGKEGEQKTEEGNEGKKQGLEESGAKAPKGKEKKSAVDPYKQEQQANQQPTDKPPNSWKPAVREHWAKIPPEARAEITRREREIQQTLSQTDNIRKFSNDLAQVIAPHQDLIRAQGSTPLHAIDNLMKTASSLSRGNTVQKANVVAQIIRNYGIDIQTLDKILSEGPAIQQGQQGQPNPNEAPPAWARPIFDFMGHVEQTRTQHQQQIQQKAQDALVEARETLPYFEDLEQEVADILEMNWKRGRNITIQQAYQKAVELNPDIKKLIPPQGKRPAGNGKNGNNSVSQAASTLAKARRASAAVSGAPAGGDGKGVPKSRREALEQAFDDAAG